MYFGELEKRTDSLEVKGEGTAEARGDSLVSGSYDRTWCCSFTRRASLERKLFGGSTCFFFFFWSKVSLFCSHFWRTVSLGMQLWVGWLFLALLRRVESLLSAFPRFCWAAGCIRLVLLRVLYLSHHLALLFQTFLSASGSSLYQVFVQCPEGVFLESVLMGIGGGGSFW